ncbi:MAG: LPP20 family lipoprotein [Breznakibacter sp.]
MRYLYLAALLLSVCSLNTWAAKPKWVKQRPNDPAYYIGIGMAAKTGGEYSYVTQARNSALKELGSEIKVSVSANSILHQFESNYAIKEEFESKVQTSVSQTLEGYEVTTWEDKKEYWVMMRLSKDKYQMNRRLALDKARKTAAMYLESGKKSANEKDFNQALVYYIKAVESISPHVEEDLTYKTFDGDINLGVSVFQNIQQLLANINLVSVQNVYTIKFSQALQLPIVVEARNKRLDNGQYPIPNLPVSFAFTRGDGVLHAEATTNLDGQATSSVVRLISKRRVQEVTATVDIRRLMTESQRQDAVMSAFFPSESMPRVSVPIEVVKSKAYFEYTENVFGQLSSTALFSNRVKTMLGDNYFTFVANKTDADVYIRLVSEFVAGDEKVGAGYSVFLVYGNFRITVFNNQNNDEVFSDGLSNIRGMMPGDYEKALKNCREKCLDAVGESIVLKLEEIDL